MQFRTSIPIAKAKQPITYKDSVVLLGSCFASNIGEKFNYYKFKHTVNPFGIIFNPIALERLITRAINDELFTETDLLFHNEQYHCFEVHSTFSNVSSETIIHNLNVALQILKAALVESKTLVITLGTAWVYRFIDTDAIVANCHKVPQKRFLKALLSVTAIEESLQAIVALVRHLNPNIQILFTVSPVRHIKDGMVENSRSKAHLLAAVHEIVEPRNDIFYFPSYEIMVDELRDYRFYDVDMLHPSALAIDYIWEQFTTNWVHQEAQTTMQLVADIQKGLQHRPFNPTSTAHQQFLKKLKAKQDAVQLLHQHINFNV